METNNFYVPLVVLHDEHSTISSNSPMPTPTFHAPADSLVDWYFDKSMQTIPVGSDDILYPTGYEMVNPVHFEEPAHFEEPDQFEELESEPGIMDDWVGKTTPSSSYPTSWSNDEPVYVTPDQLRWTGFLSEDTSQSSVEPSSEPMEKSTTMQPNHQSRFVAIAPKNSILGETPSPILQNIPAEKSGRRGRGRTKLPQDQLKKEIRRVQRPVKCAFCQEGFDYNKPRRRHYVVHHKRQALDAGLLTEADVQKTSCPMSMCSATFSRPDYLPKHMRKRHGHVS